MSDTKLTCPHCHKEIALDESLAAPLLAKTREFYESALADKDRGVSEKEAALRAQKLALDKDRSGLDEVIATRLQSERAQIAAEEERKARQLLGSELAARDADLAQLNEVIAERDRRLAEAQNVQAEFVRKSRELDNEKRALALTVETRVQEALGPLREQARQEADASSSLVLRERDVQLESMRRQIEDLKRKAEQGSQQLQGEAMEIELEALLTQKFPMDLIEPVPKGEFGGDILHRVIGPNGIVVGTILWESKHTKNWSDGWLPKLRDDQRRAEADFALMMSHALPKGLTAFDYMDGVWVCEPKCAVAVAVALRHSLMTIAKTRQASEGQQTKTELVYRYLTGPRFRQRVEAIVEKFSDMKDDLDKEKKFMTKQWAKRETQIGAVVESTAGMYGDLQGIAGKSLAEITGLDVPLLEDDS
jgi:hypothetical protein